MTSYAERRLVKSVAVIVCLLVVVMPMTAWAKGYDYEDHGFKINFPDSYNVVDRDNVDSHARLIKSYGMSVEGIKSIFDASDGVLVALRTDELAAARVHVRTDQFTKELRNLTDASDKQLDEFKSIVNDDILVVMGGDVKLQEYVNSGDGGVKFLKTQVEYENDYKDISYYTISGGKQYILKFSNYDTHDTYKTSAEIDKVFGSFEIAKPEMQLVRDPKLLMTVGGMMMLMAGGIGIAVWLRSRQRE